MPSPTSRCGTRCVPARARPATKPPALRAYRALVGRVPRRSRGSRRAVERVEVRARGHPPRAASGTTPWPHRHAHAADRRRVVARSPDFLGQPGGELRPLHLGHTGDRLQARHRHDARDHRLVLRRRAHASCRPARSSRGRRRRRTGYREVGLAELLGGVEAVRLESFADRGRGSGCAATPIEKSPTPAREPHQVDGVLELPGWQVDVLRGVAAQREEVLDTGVAVAGDDVDELGSPVTGAREVCHRRHGRVAVDVAHQLVGAFARGESPPAP